MTTDGSTIYNSSLLTSTNNPTTATTTTTSNTPNTNTTVPTDMTTSQPITSVGKPTTNDAVAAAVAANAAANVAANGVTLATDPKTVSASLPTNVTVAAVTPQPPPPPSTHMPPPMAAAAAAFGQYPHGVVFAPAEATVMEDTPTYVNPKQYARILKRRQSRKKQTGTDVTSYTPRKRSYMHESRHKHAMQRRRGPGGRFLSKEEREDMARQQKTATAGQ